jgi:transposase
LKPALLKKGLRQIYLPTFDVLVIYGFKHERIDKGIKFLNRKVYIDEIEGFWSYAKERLLKFHGVSRECFVYYLSGIILGLT